MEKSDVENREARRQRRRAAGRSGGIFEIVRDGKQIKYRYAWPEPACQPEYITPRDSVESIVSSTASDSVAGRACTGIRGQQMVLTVPEGESMHADRKDRNLTMSLSPSSTKRTTDCIEIDSEVISRTKNRRGLPTVQKMDRDGSRLGHRKTEATEGQYDGQVAKAKEHLEPQTQKSQLLEATYQSPIKEQIELEADCDPDPGQEELNKEFFTPPRAIKMSSGWDCHGDSDSEIFD
ncbi:hypothetical protein A1O3_03815 [Capronia epimyces CBS 606.96]|uniref:Uncharacterized protein n=1 Tax=Capronia epimyces CBS 606.96 TaxID=1182542 RepID=W9YCB4_9EURO|nr:uncharacterized protein A1O3_03815 [Capronia epimyces CBS 606.96]EXJ86861.1 hypothetical protein A1O3_03815 [Capronia epimyces CBS 606.96]